MSYKDAPDVNEEQKVELSFPVIQWRRGDLANENENLSGGCWQLPVEEWGTVIKDRLPIFNCIHGGGVVVESYLFGRLHIAPLAYQKKWFVMVDGKAEYQKPGEFLGGGKSRYRLLGIIKELAELGFDEPAMLTTSGLNGKAMEDAFSGFKKNVVGAAMRLAKRNFATFNFWLPLESLGKQETKKNQYVTPPGIILDNINENILEELYSGQDIAELGDIYWQAAKNWSKTNIDQKKNDEPAALIEDENRGVDIEPIPGDGDRPF